VNEATLPCPMCGAKPVLDGKSDDVRVRCEGCGVQGPPSFFNGDNDDEIEKAEAEAIAAWNRRPSAEDAPGELDPRTALATARQMLAYAQSFNGQSWGGVDESVDRKNLATALDNLEETASMLLNMADRVALARRPSVGGVTDAQIDATTDEQWGRRDDSTYYAAHRSYARAILALQPSPAVQQPGSEIRQLCALKDREAIAVNLLRHGGLNKHHARAVADAMLSAPQPVPQAEGMEACKYGSLWVGDRFTAFGNLWTKLGHNTARQHSKASITLGAQGHGYIGDTICSFVQTEEVEFIAPQQADPAALPVEAERDALRDLLEVTEALREWVKAIPQDTPLPAMPGYDGDVMAQVIDRARSILAGVSNGD
jgi:Lar family restriction alleviation protein